jgi:hypothetical protein
MLIISLRLINTKNAYDLDSVQFTAVILICGLQKSYYYCFCTPTLLLLSLRQFYILSHNYCCLYGRLFICHTPLHSYSPLLFSLTLLYSYFELMTFFKLCSSSILLLYSLLSTLLLSLYYSSLYSLYSTTLLCTLSTTLLLSTYFLSYYPKPEA